MIEEHPEGKALIIPERFLTILSNESYKSIGNTFQRIKELTLMDYSANKNYSVFKKFNSLEKLTIIGDYTEIPILKVLGKQIKKLSLCDVGAKFDLYMLNKYPYDKLEEFCFHSNKSIYISGGDLAFLQEIRKLELYFYNEYAEIEFSKFENLKQLQVLTIMSDTNYEYDYWPLSKHKTLKKIILKIPKDVEDSLYKTSNIDDTACCKELSIEEYDYPYGEI